MENTDNTEINRDEFNDKKYDVMKTLMVQASLNYAKTEVMMGLLVQILANLENRDKKDIWANVDKEMEKYKTEFMKLHAE